MKTLSKFASLRLSAHRVRPLAFSLILAGMAASAQAPADVRVALVIGNSAYPGTAALMNPANDATAMSGALQKLGFTVVELKDGTREQMAQAINTVRNTLRGKQAVGMLYYAGHGLQLDWKNYMVPVDAKLNAAGDVPQQAVDIDSVINAFKTAGNRMNIIVLDACRDNPFGDKSSGKGLAQLDAPPGTFLAYATAPGNVAEDGSGQANGLYTGYLVQELTRPAAKIEDVFKRVRLSVRKASSGRQIPWESTSLEDDFFFNDGQKYTFRMEDLQAIAAEAKRKEEALKKAAEEARERERQIALQIEQEKLRAAEAAKRAEQERLAAIERARELERQAAEAREREKQEAQKREQERLAALERAKELERQAAEAREREKQEALKREQERLAAQQRAREQERLAALAREREQQEALKREQERLAALEREREAARLKAEAEAKERERVLALQREQERQRAEAAARLAEETRRAEEQRQREIAQARAEAEAASRERLSKEQAAERAFAAEKAAWDKIADSRNPDDYYAFLARFPTGKISEQASAVLERLQAAQIRQVANKDGVVQVAAKDRFRLGDIHGYTIRDDLTKTIIRSARARVTQVTSDTVVLGDGGTVFTREGGTIRNQFIAKMDPPRLDLPSGDYVIGKKWSFKSRETNPNGQSWWTEGNVKIVSLEDVTVAAGTFKAYKLELVSFSDNGTRVKLTRWMLPDWGFPVKQLREIRPRQGAPTLETWEMTERVRGQG